MKSNFKIAILNKILFIILVVVPVLSGFIFAFLYSIGVVGILNNKVSFSAWKSFFYDIQFWKSFGFSIYVGIISVSFGATIAFILAYSWRENFKKGILSFVVYLPLCFPATVMAFIFFQVFTQSGFVSRIFYNLHLTKAINDFPELINDAYGIGIIITMIVLITPFFIILFHNIFQAEKVEELCHLATTLGTKKKDVISKIVIPVIFKKSAVTLLLFVLFVMGNYEIPLLLGRQNPQMITVAIVQKIQRFNLYDIPSGYAMSVFYVVMILLFLLFIVIKNPNFFNSKETND